MWRMLPGQTVEEAASAIQWSSRWAPLIACWRKSCVSVSPCCVYPTPSPKQWNKWFQPDLIHESVAMPRPCMGVCVDSLMKARLVGGYMKHTLYISNDLIIRFDFRAIRAWFKMACPFCGDPVDITRIHFIIWTRDHLGIIRELRYHIVCWNVHASLQNVEWINWGRA